MPYTKFDRGSEWRKWDLHIHTPETKKNDQFEGKNANEKWDKYIDAINNSEEEISVIGITDYFSIENYFKFKDFATSGRITKQFDLILPNIELRVLPVTGSSTPINLHCIFNPAIDSEIESRFLGKLKFTNSKSSYSATKKELIRFGRDHTDNQYLEEELAYIKGVEQYVVDLESLRNIFKSDPDLRTNTIICISNKSTDGVTGIIKHEDFFINISESQLDATRQSFYQFSDAIFSPNENDRNYFIGKRSDDIKTVIRKCGSLKPCFHGCDAHSLDKIFKPDANRFCWIKADPTFNGLKQSLYESEDRVRVQALRPDVKNERYVISEVQFLDSGSLFGNQKILFNENLNAVIGGKSSGKSLLMYLLANSIDPEQVEKASKRLAFSGYKFDSAFDFKVIWKNGDEDFYRNSNPSSKIHKITYIPQLYINYLVEKNNKEELNTLIKNILLQDNDYRIFFEETTNQIEVLNGEIERLLTEFLKVRTKALDVQQKSKDIGNSENIKNSIQKIEASILEGQKASNLNEIEFKEYSALLNQKSEKEIELEKVNTKELVLAKVVHETKASQAALLGKTQIESDVYLKGQVDRILDELGDIPESIMKIKDRIQTDFDSLIANLESEIKELNLVEVKSKATSELADINLKLTPFLLKIEGQQELQKLTTQLESEKTKLQNSLTLESQLRNLIEEYGNIRKQKSLLLRQRIEKYSLINQKVNDTKKEIGSGIELTSNLTYKLENFALHNQVNKAALNNSHFFYSFIKENSINFDLIPDFYDKQLKLVDDKLVYGKDEFIPLKLKSSFEDILRGLIKDAFEIDYSVTYKGDDLLNMSPGKKGTVLLILFLQISSSEFPILIDQPEDNLDNRTIYDLLCTMIKSKKRDRQVIIVSHNANLVVATDAENIIVANQQGQNAKTEAGAIRFEYINGSLEHSFPQDIDIKSILLNQGIREHVCDILEGGDEAFKQRERKYAIR